LKATSKARRLEEHTKKNVFFYGVERFLLRVFRGFVVAFLAKHNFFTSS